MPHSLEVDQYVAALEVNAGRLLAALDDAGLDVEVPTCPTWDGRGLLAHQAMVHRWATAHLTDAGYDAIPNQSDLRQHESDLAGYYRTGVQRLLAAIRAAPDDLEAMTFLNDAPAPRVFWARRQAHETTIHMVDAMAARLGRPPTAHEAAIDHDLAVDGIDEILCGFFTRGRSKLFDGVHEFDAIVEPDDCPRRWRLHVAEKMTVTVDPDDHASTTIRGTAASIYLALWNRAELEVDGDQAFAGKWRTANRIRWS